MKRFMKMFKNIYNSKNCQESTFLLNGGTVKRFMICHIRNDIHYFYRHGTFYISMYKTNLQSVCYKLKS